MGAHGKGRFEILEMPIHGELVPMTPWRRVRRWFVLGGLRAAPVMQPLGRVLRRAVSWVVFGFLWAVCGALESLMDVVVFVGGALLLGAATLALLAFGFILLAGIAVWAFHMTASVRPLVYWGERAVAGVFVSALALWFLGSLARFIVTGIQNLSDGFARRAGLPTGTPLELTRAASASSVREIG